MSKLFREVKRIKTVESSIDSGIDSAVNSTIISIMEDYCVPVRDIEIQMLNRISDTRYDAPNQYAATLIYKVREFDKTNMKCVLRSMYEMGKIYGHINNVFQSKVIKSENSSADDKVNYDKETISRVMDILENSKLITGYDDMDIIYQSTITELKDDLYYTVGRQCSMKSLSDIIAGSAIKLSNKVAGSLFNEIEEGEAEKQMVNFCKQNNIDLDSDTPNFN